jgi:hypothetical protein
MTSATDILKDIQVPRMVRVKRTFDTSRIEDVYGTVFSAMNMSRLADRLSPGNKIAVGVGSRGIADLVDLVRGTIDWFKDQDCVPFIVPAMGSHGGATAEGQKAMLERLGITEKLAGCPIRSSMNAVTLGHINSGQPVYMDPYAAEADGIFVISRIKPATAYTAKHESGLLKMFTIGLGKQLGASSCHELGFHVFPQVMPAMTRLILEKKKTVLGALAIVENAYDKLCVVEAVPAEKLELRDAELLDYARTRIATPPVDTLDVMLVDKMGKNISGPGMDPNVTGRFLSGVTTPKIHISKLAVFDLTDITNGNANGVGAADVINKRIFNKINFDYTYMNCFTSTITRNVAIPLMLESDENVIQACIKTCHAGSRPLRMLRIRDTLTLDRLLVSPALAEELKDLDDCEILGTPEPMHFDKTGNLTDGAMWDTFG